FWSNDTWSYGGGKWTNLTSTAGPAPPPVLGLLMTYDAADGYVVAWGGSSDFDSYVVPCNGNSFSMCNATWAFQSGHWRELPTRTASPATACGDSASMTYDAAARYVLLWLVPNGG